MTLLIQEDYFVHVTLNQIHKKLVYPEHFANFQLFWLASFVKTTAVLLALSFFFPPFYLSHFSFCLLFFAFFGPSRPSPIAFL
jgi:hypothetical protein